MIRELVESLERNSLFSGGLMLMAIGSAAAFLRGLPGEIGRFLERRISIWVEIPDRDPAFRWVQTWLAAQPYAKRARDLSLSTTWVSTEPDPTVDTNPYTSSPSGPASQAQFLLSPGPGVHLMIYRRRILILYRTRRDLQNGGTMAAQMTCRETSPERSRVPSLD